MDLQIKPLEIAHWPAVEEIYLEGINTQLATFETSSPGWENWDMSHHPFCRYVAIENNLVVGWIALLPVSKRKAYQGVAEVSVYTKETARGKGVGKALMKQLISNVEEFGIYTLQCSLFPENNASLALHKAFNFREIGYREKVAKLNGKWHTTLLMERRSQTKKFN